MNTNYTNRLRVLLVEDSLPVRERVRLLVEESAPVEIVGEAATAAGALALFHARQPDAVVLDLSLESGDGREVLAEIKRARPECLVIVLTNFSTPESRARIGQMGADHFFDKSGEFERVPEALEQFLRARGGVNT